MEQIEKKWELAINAFKGSGGFTDGTYIDQYPRESDDKYAMRQEVAYYTNMFSQKVSRYIGYLYRQKPIRTTSNKLTSMVMVDADNKGSSMDVFMSNFAARGKTMGSMLLLVDMPSDMPATLAEQIENRAVPYFVSISPLRVTDYKMDKFGKFESVKFTDTIDVEKDGEAETIEIERYYDQMSWAVLDGDNVIDSGDHNLGVCPVLSFSETGEYPDIGEFTQVGELAKRHYNLKSELDEMLRSQTFSILTFQARSPKDVEISIGTDNAISYAPEMERPGFIAPPDSPASTYQTEIETMESMINQITYDVSTSKSAESGISLEIKFQGLNGSLSKFAIRLQNLEERAFDVVTRYLNVTNDVVIRYPSDFNIVDPTTEIITLEAIKSLGYTLPAYEKAKLQRIVNSDLSGIDDEEMVVINAEIEDGLKGG